MATSGHSGLELKPGMRVVLQPLPWAGAEYGAFAGQHFTIHGASATEDGPRFELERDGVIVLVGVDPVHLCDADNIVKARAECVSAKSLASLLGYVRRFVVPLYQRKYCWDTAQWEGLWRDVCGMKAHDLGRVVLYEESWQSRPHHQSCEERVAAQRTLVVVDGQQRITTCCLLIAAIRDCLRPAHGRQADELNDVLLPRGPANLSTTDAVLESAVLIPTEDDRAAFAAVLGGFPAPTLPSQITKAHAFFRAAAESFQSSDGDLGVLSASILSSLSLLLFELDDGEAAARYFEQLHLRNMMLSSQMNNRAPGVDLAEYDLLRNFLLGHFRGDEQALIYRQYWLELERVCMADGGSMDQLETCLRSFLLAEGQELPASAPPSGLPTGSIGSSLYGAFRALVCRLVSQVPASALEETVSSLLARMLAHAQSRPDPASNGQHDCPSRFDAGLDAVCEGDEEEDEDGDP